MRILHLSDVHFGLRQGAKSLESRSTHRFVDATGSPDSAALSDIITRDETARLADLIIISGDIGWSGRPEDYEYAISFLRRLERILPVERIVLAPGNHDVDITSSVPFSNRQSAYETLVRDFYGSKLQDHYPALDGTDDALQGRERLLAIHETESALVISVNSAALQDTGSIPIAVTPRVLRYLETVLQTRQPGLSLLRVFVLHHHLFPFVEAPWRNQIDVHAVYDQPDDTIVANSARLQHWLTRHRFDLVLHGHKHMHHGRQDRLWRPGTQHAEARRLVVIGAGSSGVSDDQRPHGEPISYNVIDATASADQNWRIRIDAKQIDESRSPISAEDWFRYSATAGLDTSPSAHVFSARHMDDCHADISRSVSHTGGIRNFVSTVEDSTYIHPSTLRLYDTVPAFDQVERSFRSLHPEYSEVDGWENEGRVKDAAQIRRDRMEHGTRLFRPGARGVSPISAAMRLVDERHTWAYVGLYRPTLDTEHHPRPMPGLMGIQLLPDEERRLLNITATFRNLELSFWWAVNMLEMRKLLEYAAPRCGSSLRPGAVTMFAAIAEWRANPDPVLTARLDELGLPALLSLALKLRQGDGTAAESLINLLGEKAELTSRNNVETEGLRNLIAALEAAQSVRYRRARDLTPIIDILNVCRSRLTFTDLSRTPDRTEGVLAARGYLQEACESLRFARDR